MSSIPLDLSSFSKRAKRALAWSALGRGLLVSSLLALVLAALDFFRVIWMPLELFVGVLAAGPLAGILWATTRKLSDQDLAASIDRRAGLKDQTSTALEVSGASALEPLLKTAASNALTSRPAKELFPIQMKRAHWVGLAIAVVAGGLYYAGVTGVFLSSNKRTELSEVKSLAPEVEKIARDIKPPLADDPFGGETREITGNLEKFAREMEMGRLPREEALTKANKILDDAKALEEKRFKAAETGLNNAEASLKAMALDRAQKSMGEAAIPMSADQKEMSAAQLSTENPSLSAESLKAQADALQSQIDGLKKQLSGTQGNEGKALTQSEVAKLQSALKQAEAQQKQVETARRAQDELSKMLDNPVSREMMDMGDRLGKELQRRLNGEAPQMSDADLKFMSDRLQELKKQAGGNEAQQKMAQAVQQALNQMQAASEMGEQMRKLAETMDIQQQLNKNQQAQAASPELQRQLEKMLADPKFADMQKQLQDAMKKSNSPQGFLSKEQSQAIEKELAKAASKTGAEPAAKETLEALQSGAKALEAPSMSPQDIDALKKALDEAKQIAENGKRDQDSQPVSPEVQQAMRDLMNSLSAQELQKAAEKAAQEAANAAEQAAKQLTKEDLQKLQDLANTITERHPEDSAIQPPLESLQEQLGRLEQGKMDAKQAEQLRQAVEQSKSLAESGKTPNGQQQASPEGQQSMSELMASPEMKKLAEALQSQAQNGQGQQSPMSPEQMQQMMQRMQQMAQQLQSTPGGQELARQLSQAMSAGGQGMNPQAMQQMMSALNAMRQASQGLGGTGGRGSDPYTGQGQLNKNGQFKDFKSGSKLGGIRGERGNQGSETYMDIKGPTRLGGASSVPYTKVISGYERQAEKAITTKKIPKKREGRVKDYFESLRQGKK